jgi:hypothetical protein
MADDVVLWPLRAVSKDPTNVTKLDADNNVLTSTTDIAASFVRKSGDTTTGPLAITAGATITPLPTAVVSNTTVHVVRDGAAAFMELYSTGPGTAGLLFRKKAGTLAAPAAVPSNQATGVIRWQVKPTNGAADRTHAQISLTATSVETADGYYDSVMSFSCGGSSAATATANFGMRHELGVRQFFVTCDNFVVDTAGFVTAQSGFRSGAGNTFSVDTAGYIVSKSGLRVERAQNGDCLRVLQSNILANQSAVGLYSECHGSSDNDVALVGVSANAKGVCTRGVGLVANAESAGSVANFAIQAFSKNAVRNVGLYIDSGLLRANDSYAIQSVSPAASYFAGAVGIGWADPTHTLEVGGTTMLRNTLEVTGNITSSGTAHSFVASSIPSTAVIGNTPRTIAATGSAGNSGQMVWDDNFIYLRTTSGWKKVALTAL